MIDVHIPTTDGRELRLTRYTESDAELRLLLDKLKLALPAQHRQGDVLAFQLAVNLSPIGLDVTPMALLGAGGREQRRLQRAVGHLRRQWPAQPGSRQSLQRSADRATTTEEMTSC
jgi:hypothetical protein